MKVLIVGNGGREHALLWKLSRDEPAAEFFITQGSGGTGKLAKSVPLPPTDVEGIVAFCLKEKPDLVVVGPELPLELGLSDRLTGLGISVFGPTKAAARMETSKSFAKELMRKYDIPTASFEIFTSFEQASSYVRAQKVPLVVKASGLAAGKGAIVCEGERDALDALHRVMVEKIFGEAGNEVVVEERLFGEELSFFVLTDGARVLPLSPSQDHKRIYDEDKGPNTGGMGAYAPVSIATASLMKRVMDEIVVPTITAMREEGHPYRGVLYAGLMLTREGPRVIEFNARFGDPEAQVNLPLLSSNLLGLMHDISSGTLREGKLRFEKASAVCVVMASRGYPGDYEKGKLIHIPDGIEKEDLVIFHAGTTAKDGRLITSGGRVLGVTALGKSIAEARDRCYEAVEEIRFEGRHFRKDIAHREIERVCGRGSA
jgi:phosphoribosylamine--glycine ligase